MVFSANLFQTFSGKGKTMTETWERMSRIDGDYIFVKGENYESYFKAVGHTDLIDYIDTFKIHFRKKDKTIYMRKRFGDLGNYYNVLEMDTESPYFTLGDKHGNVPEASQCLCHS